MRGIHVYTSVTYGQSASDQPWPKDLREIVEKGLHTRYDESSDLLNNPQRPKMKPAYIYVKPGVPLSRIDNPGRIVAVYEAYDQWGKGINVGFLDGHVSFISSEKKFQELLRLRRAAKYSDLTSSATGVR